MLRQNTVEKSKRIFHMAVWGVIALLYLTMVASAQSVQTIDSEARLASMLCQNPAAKAASELLNKNSQFVSVGLWNKLGSCVSVTQRQRSGAKSIQIYKLMLRVAEQLGNPELVATSYYYIGRTYTRTHDFENSIQAYEASRNLFEQTGNAGNLIIVLANLGALYLETEDHERAQECSEEGLAIARRLNSNSPQESLVPIEYGRARSLQTLGEIDHRHGNHAKALKRLYEAVALLERVNGTEFSHNGMVADVLISLAKVYCEMGAYGDALSYLTKAHQVSRTSGDRNVMANIMSGQASVFLEQEDYARAQAYLNASLDIHRSDGNTREEARVMLQLASVEQRQGHHDDALLLFQRTMDRANTVRLADVQIAAGGGLGVVFIAKRDFPNALKVINQSLDIARRVNAKTREVELLLCAAQAFHAMQNYREAASFGEQALTLARALRLPKFTYLATAALGEAYAADGKVDSAITTLKDAISQVEELRDQVVAAHEGRQLFFENKVGPYHTLVMLLANQGKNFEALLYAERAKGRVLLEAVRNNRSDIQNIYTEAEKAEAESLIKKYHGIYQRIQDQGDESNDELQNELKGIRSELVLFQKRLAAAHPELLLRTGSARPLTQVSLKNLTSANDLAYLEYVVTHDTVGIFLVKRNGFTADYELKYVNLPVTADELRRKVNDFHSALAERQPDHDRLGRELYRLLIAPVAADLQSIRTVCIIPDGFLWTLPFQALTTTSGNYFVQEYALYYAPSLTVLNEMASRRRQQTSKESVIAFGNPVVEKNDQLPQDLHSLPDAEAEVAAVATAVRTRMTKVLVGVQAREKTFKALAPQYATIHIATHGFLNDRDPLNSFLILTRTNGDPENDGLLKAREIIEMHLDADLAVLSACQTGNGRIGAGEGVVGMSWAFLIAGARSVVVSQWRVNSASTSQLMKNFYQAMGRQNNAIGRNKSQALREASLSLLKDRRYHHPFYWAGFMLLSSN